MVTYVRVQKWMLDNVCDPLEFSSVWGRFCKTPMSFKISQSEQDIPDRGLVSLVLGSKPCLIKTGPKIVQLTGVTSLAAEIAGLQEDCLVQEIVGSVDGRMVYAIDEQNITFLSCLVKNDQGELNRIDDQALLNNFCKYVDSLAEQLLFLGHRGYLECKVRMELSGVVQIWVIGARLQLSDPVRDSLEHLSEPVLQSLVS